MDRCVVLERCEARVRELELEYEAAIAWAVDSLDFEPVQPAWLAWADAVEDLAELRRAPAIH